MLWTTLKAEVTARWMGDDEAVAAACMRDTDDGNRTCQAALASSNVQVMGELFDGRSEFHWPLPQFVVAASLADSG